MFFEKNMSVVKRIYPSIYHEIINHLCDKDRYQVIVSREGFYTVKVNCINNDGKTIYLHSKYNPVQEARVFAKKHFQPQNSVHVVYGFGFGYVIEELLLLMSEQDQLFIFDINIDVFIQALVYRDMESLLLDNRLKIIISNNQSLITNEMSKYLSEKNSLILHMPSVRTIPEKYERFKFALEDWNIQQSVSKEWIDLLEKNLIENSQNKSENIGNLFGTMKNHPIVIISAGPSLNKNIHRLKELKGKAFLFAVGSALKPLLRAGVTPDMFCIIDPQEITYKQIEGFEDLNIPLVYLDTASSYTVSKYNGPKYITCNDKERVEKQDYLVELGGSVATAVMDITIKFAGNPIIFVGQDLAFTNNEHHADGKMYGGGEKINSLPNMRKVDGQDGTVLSTTLGLLSFKYWIENKIEDNPHIKFINATEGGAFIRGCKHMTLHALIPELN